MLELDVDPELDDPLPIGPPSGNTLGPPQTPLAVSQVRLPPKAWQVSNPWLAWQGTWQSFPVPSG